MFLHPKTPESQHRANLWLAWAWFAFGIYGLIAWMCVEFGWATLPDVANSIPVLFGISVYANFVGHLSAAQAARAEVKIEQATTVDVEHADRVDVDQQPKPET